MRRLSPPLSRFARWRAAAGALAAAFALAVLASVLGGDARAQTAVCSSTPAPGQRVECVSSNADPIDIDLDGVDISATADSAYGVFLNQDFGASGAIDLSVTGSSIETSGGADGIYVLHRRSGDIGIRIVDSSIKDLGNNRDHALRVWASSGSHTGAIDIYLDRARLFSSDDNLHITQDRSGDVRIGVRDSVFSAGGDHGRGIIVSHTYSGVLDLSVVDSSIKTAGDNSAGGIVAIKRQFDDTLRIALDGVAIKTTGGQEVLTFPNTGHLSRAVFSSHGVLAEHRDSGSVEVSVRGGSIDVSGADQHGIAIGGIPFNGNSLYATSARDEDGYRRQTVWVDGPVQGGSGSGAGVALYGGGRVFIGPNGRVGAASGTAIRAAMRTGQAAADNPKLYVGLRPGGRRISDLLKGSIVNEGGASRTTVAVNGVVLMDAGTVAEGVLAPNGARDVWLRAEADGANIAVADFLDPFAPRAAVYEALPGFLLRLDEADGGGDFRAPESPFWLRVSGGRGSYRPESASVGARHRHTRYGVEAGVDFPLDEGLAGWAGVRAVSGSARVSAATGGGRIEASGFGLAGGLSWENAEGFYGTGRVSLTRYGVDYSSSARGRLASGASALVHALDLEGGRRFALEGETVVAPWVRLGYSGASMDGVTDAVGSRISIAEADRRTLGVGADAEIELDPGSGEERLALRGSFGLERPFGGGTAVRVSAGEELESKAPDGVRVLLGVGAVWKTGPFALEGGLSANGLGSDDRDFSGYLTLRTAF
ncbi:MAG: autotransporter outer membrane beta-barrel domain-containing protein [Alphaproteobacteria bacterium]|nr:autotransporter outer membrane beta-barrel domain-containing protein [Alphaproteobacteria bacterium]